MQQIQKHIAIGWSRVLDEVQSRFSVLKNAAVWRDLTGNITVWKVRFYGTFQHVPKRWKWRILVTVILLLLGLFLGVHHAVSSSETANKDGIVPEEMAVLCIGVVRYRNGVKDAFFQRPGEPLEALLMERKDAAQVSEGFTVEHRDCYESWQAAADFLTDGQLTLPDNANEAIFSMSLLKWKLQQMQAGN